MKILFLGYDRSETRLIDELEELGHTIESTKDPMSSFQSFDLVVSFGYRHIVSAKTIQTASRPPLNLHISYLPYNRGAHPNFWSCVENTPAGVSIHEIDAGVDTGPIVFQERCTIAPDMTLRESHALLVRQVEALFTKNSSRILKMDYVATRQEGKGTFHRAKDLPDWVESWDIKIPDAIKKYREWSKNQESRDTMSAEEGSQHRPNTRS